MPKVKIYRAGKYDIGTDNIRESNRWWTKEGADRHGLILEESTGIEVEDSELEVAGEYTEHGYNPHRHEGF
ncbi:hypothetical protein [Rhizobium sp. BK251]|uniref:hypothetical protein n=1 Tax=Rhizobium sp. BK251 TaxID=2512125 RepID=UPI001051B709|nr:hypothetical protein [Rhizobium sp. BK251]TCL62901.1 hypothetical protein EV286_1187 [Rhizobium sp. BK251]